MMQEEHKDHKYININVRIVERSFRLKIKADQEEVIRRAVKVIEERVESLKQNYQVEDSRDYLGMALLLFAVDVLNNEEHTKHLEETHQLLQSLDGKLKDFFII